MFATFILLFGAQNSEFSLLHPSEIPHKMRLFQYYCGLRDSNTYDVFYPHALVDAQIVASLPVEQVQIVS